MRASCNPNKGNDTTQTVPAKSKTYSTDTGLAKKRNKERRWAQINSISIEGKSRCGNKNRPRSTIWLLTFSTTETLMHLLWAVTKNGFQACWWSKQINSQLFQHTTITLCSLKTTEEWRQSTILALGISCKVASAKTKTQQSSVILSAVTVTTTPSRSQLSTSTRNSWK